MAKRSTTEAKGKATSGTRTPASSATRPASTITAGGDSSGKERNTNSPTGLTRVEFNARVARKAYDLFERRGRQEGHDVEDWLEAERLVKEELHQQSEVVAS